MYVALRRNLPRLLVIDLTTQIASKLAIQGNQKMSDWAIEPDDLLYGLNADTGIIATIDSTNGAVFSTAIPVPTIFGIAVWFDQNGDFRIYSQSTGNLNQIRIGSGFGEIETIGTGRTASGANGAACATSLVTQDPPPTPVSTNSKSTYIVIILLFFTATILRFNFREQ